MGSLTLEQFKSPLLDPIDLQLSAGDCITINGPSGSGKTRLLRALADLEPSQGRVWLNKEEKGTITGPQWRHKVGLLLAESGWWTERVGDHFSRPEPELFDRLEIPHDAVEWEISRLSSGERQRLSLIRLLSNHPQVLLLDEPTANLDQGNSAKVEALIEYWRQQHQVAVLWVSHDPQQRQRVSKQSWVIDSGRLRREQ
ncbi:MAG: ATP-binding cassette domain-containing protein [Candidatus Thiodiazotropha sp. 6PLUC2]